MNKSLGAAPAGEPFEILGRRVAPGTTAYLEGVVARLPVGGHGGMPIVVVQGVRPGPVMWVNGVLHGDELNGVGIARGLVARVDPRALAGTLITVPIVNVFGATAGTRYLPDRRDLNRAFPGSPRGSLASRLAYFFLHTVVERCALGIDCHTGSDGRTNLPHVRCDLDDEQTRQYADAFGAPVTLHARPRPGSLRGTAAERGVRALVFEGGEARRFDEEVIERAVDGALRVMHALGMIDDPPPAPAGECRRARRSYWARAGRSGFFRMGVALGARVTAGDDLGTISESTGHHAASVRAQKPGIVIGAQTNALVYRGDAVVHIAEVEA